MWSRNFLFSISVTLIVVTVDGGYNYLRPVASYNVPTYSSYQQYQQHQSLQNYQQNQPYQNYQHTSYSLPYQRPQHQHVQQTTQLHHGFQPIQNTYHYQNGNHYNHGQQNYQDQHDNGFQPIVNTYYELEQPHRNNHQQYYSEQNNDYYNQQHHGLISQEIHETVYHEQHNQQSDQVPVIKKYIYVHVPPPDEEKQPQVQLPVEPPKKSYKIIFIKVPEPQTGNQYQMLQQKLQAMEQTVEEKTLIYVLTKKPEPKPDIVMPVNTVVDSKPEVFYVKYKDSQLDNIASKVNLELAAGESAAELGPGLVNGNPVNHYR